MGRQSSLLLPLLSSLTVHLKVPTCVCVLLVIFHVAIAAPFTDANWVSMGNMPGVNGTAYASVRDATGNLYLGGQFTTAGGVITTNIAKWDGTNWSAVGTGFAGAGSSDAVRSLAIFNGILYAGGNFTSVAGVPANYIAKWDGANWSAVGAGLSSTVTALATAGGYLYAGGNWTSVNGDTSARSIARWDGFSWSGVGAMNSLVNALTGSGNDLYAAGAFTRITNNGTVTSAPRVAKWDGSNWSALGGGVSSLAYALVVSGSDVYVGGSFTAATNAGVATTVNRIAKWDGSSWNSLGTGVGSGSETVYGLAIVAGNVYAGGTFTTAGGATANRIARWNGSAWNQVGSGITGQIVFVYSLTPSGSDVYASGQFVANSGTINGILKWNGSALVPLGSGISGRVNAFALLGSDLYMGGSFASIDGVTVNNIAKWDGNDWTPVGAGLDSTVYALAVLNGNLYVGGVFTNALNTGGTPVAVNRMARWNGSAWSPLGSGVDNIVNDLAASGSDLYVSGGFTYATNAGGSNVQVNRVAKWDGSGWSGLGLGLNNWVYALALSGTDVYVGGDFTAATNSAGGMVAATRVAKWNGSTWSALSSGMENTVTALATWNGDLYAGGYFTTAGGVTVNHIGRWNGSVWSALGTGLDQISLDLRAGSDGVYVGGYFTTATVGGTPVTVNRITKWDGSGWNAFGSGVNLPVASLLPTDTTLYVGGFFTVAGGKVSAYAAKAIIGTLPLVISGAGVTNGQFYFKLTGPNGSNAVIQASSNLLEWTPILTNALTGGTSSFTDSQQMSAPRKFYRALLAP